jgi:cytoskeleton-associated protein 5
LSESSLKYTIYTILRSETNLYFISFRTFDNVKFHRPDQPKAPSGPFGLDENLIADIERNWVRSEKIKLADLPPLDLGFLDEAIKIKPHNGVSYPSDRLAQLLTKSPSRPHSASVPYQTTTSPHHLFSSPTLRPSTAPSQMNDNVNFESPKLDTKLTNMIKGIGHPDRLVAHASLNELSDILDSQEKQAVLRDYEEIYIMSVLDQFKVRLFFTNF